MISVSRFHGIYIYRETVKPKPDIGLIGKGLEEERLIRSSMFTVTRTNRKERSWT
jgi:hypothetical protein